MDEAKEIFEFFGYTLEGKVDDSKISYPFQ
jgi:hypothetical protein